MAGVLDDDDVGLILIECLNDTNFGGGLLAVLNDSNRTVLHSLVSDLLAYEVGSTPGKGAGAELLAFSSNEFQY